LQALSNTVWAFSKLGQEDKALLDAVAVASVPQLSQFNAQNLANLVTPTWLHQAKPQTNLHGTCTSYLLASSCCMFLSTRQYVAENMI
jgi:hypothetical protein